MVFGGGRRGNTSENSLKEDIKKAIQKNASGDSDIDQYSEDLSNAFKDFLTRQEFRVVKMESEIEVKNIRTTDGLPVDVSPDTLFGPYTPVISIIKKIAGLVPGADSIVGALESKIKSSIRKVSGGGATLPKMNLGQGGQGGDLNVDGISSVDTIYKGKKSPQGISKKSTVVLFKDEIND